MKDKIKVIIDDRQKTVKIPTGTRMLVRRCCNAVLRNEKFEGSAEISVSFVDNEAIHKLNLEYREKDKPTDVLSFPMWEKEELLDGSALDGHAVTLGDIIISTEKATSQAEEYGHSIEREICFLSVHSILHLLGYDHETSEEDEIHMKTKQEEVLIKIGLPRN